MKRRNGAPKGAPLRGTMRKRAATIVEKAVAQFLRSLQERNASPHTIKAYRTDLAQFAEYVGPRGWRDIDHVLIRGYLSSLYQRGLSKTSVARALAALRSLYKWLAQEGEFEQNPAALVATPRLPKKLPRVPTIEEVNTVLDAAMPECSAFNARPLDSRWSGPTRRRNAKLAAFAFRNRSSQSSGGSPSRNRLLKITWGSVREPALRRVVSSFTQA